MKKVQFDFLLEQLTTELSALITGTNEPQQARITDVIAEVFVDYDLDIAGAYDEMLSEQAEFSKHAEDDYMNDQADDLRSQMIADRMEDELKEGIL